jgi:ATP-dependent RNA helicase DDX51/DBP6
MKLVNLFPVQKKVIPFILDSCNNQSIYPNDLCILAPTGSGKTLTYVLPIIKNLRTRITPCCKVLVILPVSDLAEQVYNVFKEQISYKNQSNLQFIQSNEIYETNNNLKVILLSNKNPFYREQALLINNESGKCHIDIVVATPGRLVDHIQKTSGFELNYLKYLVLDECDRIMDQIKQNWLQILSQAIFSNTYSLDNLVKYKSQNDKTSRNIINSDYLNVFNLCVDKTKLMPFQKLLLSATLTRNPEKLEKMELFLPIYFTVGAEKLQNLNENETNKITKELNESIDVKNYENFSKETKMISELLKNKKQLDNGLAEISVPDELNEIFVQVLLKQKPLIALYFIKLLNYKRMLCFVKSKESAKRLNKLFQLNNIRSFEYSSSLHSTRRKKLQLKFDSGDIDVLVCSDVMARGMDLKNVKYVLLYDAPMHLSSYIHKVGRTARAGQTGTAITFLEHKEVFFFKKMMLQISTKNESEVNKKLHKVKEIKVLQSKLKPLINDYKNSLLMLKEALHEKSSNQSDQKINLNDKVEDKNSNNFTVKKRYKRITNIKFTKRIRAK